MALVWMAQEGGDRYEVRRAGQNLRLYTNGVFHSQYNSRQPVTGGIWDTLMLPALARPPEHCRRVLVLGVGGGAVLRQLQHFVRPTLMVGIELNPVHLSVARRFFGLKGPNIALHQADALTWVDYYQGPLFDLIIDDLFGHVDGEAERVVAPDEHWCGRLIRLLKPEGTLVINCDRPRTLRAAAPLHGLRAEFTAGWALTVPGYENQVGAFFRAPVDVEDFLRRLRGWPALDQGRSRCRLRYGLRDIF
ncbi:spermidine synthase [Marinimicrobium alkaliphilum]|uniref:spermidine synthase n=1 Tax=Marinimicrobium alkaliphilum TaxID=2202654 RepID=UPI000DB958C8|nr:methyltransferase domain-containing protein [Marinimicrobium alkaliphilum]